ncbi:MAG: type II toxin-antitoxin system prevent-host-death family antitoxin [Zoogloeaceae bacterium]|jgi:prevent-host-death family protein|nr:type II toxin-antitoxin system prevent-host-death family antitoxin [Zoogloeaceae bacterium]
MTITTLSSREFNQDVTHAKKASRHGPVFITDRGKPAHVLLSIEEYARLTGQRRNLVEALSMQGLSEIDCEIPLARALPRPADVA